MTNLTLYTLSDSLELESEMNSFDCGNEEINTFLREGSVSDSVKNIMRTRILFSEEENCIIGFFSLNTASVSVIDEETQQKLSSVKDSDRYVFPTIQLSFLAIDKKYQRKQYGTFLLLQAYQTVISISGRVGCVGLSLSAVYKSIEFYETNNFTFLDNFVPTENDTVNMLMDIPTIQKILEIASTDT